MATIHMIDLETRKMMLEAILNRFYVASQWIFSSQLQSYFNEATGLIKFLEICDCGSIGGYDLDSPVKHKYIPLYDRFIALVKKYHSVDEFKYAGKTIDEIGKFFIKVDSISI